NFPQPASPHRDRVRPVSARHARGRLPRKPYVTKASAETCFLVSSGNSAWRRNNPALTTNSCLKDSATIGWPTHDVQQPQGCGWGSSKERARKTILHSLVPM